MIIDGSEYDTCNRCMVGVTTYTVDACIMIRYHGNETRLLSASAKPPLCLIVQYWPLDNIMYTAKMFLLLQMIIQRL